MTNQPGDFVCVKINIKQNLRFYLSGCPCLQALIKKKPKIFLQNKEIQKGAVAKSYMTNGLLIYD
jgi:hypothetical protein